MTYAILNGQLLNAQDASISIQDRGFRFGDGVFETIALHNGVPYQYNWHIKRLIRGLEALHIPFDTHILQPFCRQLIHKNAARMGSLRIQITRGNGSRGYLPAPENGKESPCFVIETIPQMPPPPQPVNLWLSSYRKISPQALPISAKLCQGLNSTLARIQAQEHGCFEALMLNEKSQLCEGSSSNIFWMKDSKLFTPALSCGLLEGSTRASIFRLCDVKEVETNLEALLEANCVMICNTGWGVLPVSNFQPADITWAETAPALHIGRKLLEDRDQDARANAAQWLIQ